MDWFKRLLAFSAIALALLALITMFVPLSSRIYTVEEARLYPITVTTTSSTTLIKVEYKTYTSISTSTIEFGSSSENFASKDLSECPPILEAKLYVDLKRGDKIRIDGDLGELMICDPEYTMIFYYLSYSQGPLKSRIIEVEKDGEYTIQLRWRRPNNLYEIIEHNQHRIFATPYREVPVENIITQTKTFYSTAMLINVKTLTSYSAITLTEKAPLSHRYGWLPYLLSSLMIGSVAGLAIPFILESRSKRRPKAAVAMPGVKLCPSCGVENPLDAEYCMECGVRLQP